MALGQKYGGRTKGTPNKLTSSIKDAFSEAFERLGGVKALVLWGSKNQTDFYKLASRLIPIQVNADIAVKPEARAYPLGLPVEQDRLPASSETVDSVH